MTGFHSRQMLRNSFFVQLLFVTPVSFVAVKALISSGLDVPVSDYLWFEAGAAGMWSMTTMAAGMIGFQRFQGTLPFLAISPHTPSGVFTPLIASTTCSGLLCFPIAALATILCGGRIGWSYSPAIWLFLGLLVIGCVAAALTIAVFFVLSRNAVVYEVLLVVPVWILSGIVTSTDSFPPLLKAVSLLSPLTGPATSVRSLIAGKPPELMWVVVSAFVILLWFAVARLGLRRALRRARSQGTLALI